MGLPEKGESSQKKTDFYRFTHRILAAMDDVDEETLNEDFPDGVAGMEISNTFYITPKSAFMLADFIKNCGIETNGKTIRASLS